MYQSLKKANNFQIEYNLASKRSKESLSRIPKKTEESVKSFKMYIFGDKEESTDKHTLSIIKSMSTSIDLDSQVKHHNIKSLKGNKVKSENQQRKQATNSRNKGYPNKRYGGSDLGTLSKVSEYKMNTSNNNNNNISNNKVPVKIVLLRYDNKEEKLINYNPLINIFNEFYIEGGDEVLGEMNKVGEEEEVKTMYKSKSKVNILKCLAETNIISGDANNPREEIKRNNIDINKSGRKVGEMGSSKSTICKHSLPIQRSISQISSVYSQKIKSPIPSIRKRLKQVSKMINNSTKLMGEGGMNINSRGGSRNRSGSVCRGSEEYNGSNGCNGYNGCNGCNGCNGYNGYEEYGYTENKSSKYKGNECGRMNTYGGEVLDYRETTCDVNNEYIEGSSPSINMKRNISKSSLDIYGISRTLDNRQERNFHLPLIPMAHSFITPQRKKLSHKGLKVMRSYDISTDVLNLSKKFVEGKSISKSGDNSNKNKYKNKNKNSTQFKRERGSLSMNSINTMNTINTINTMNTMNGMITRNRSNILINVNIERKNKLERLATEITKYREISPKQRRNENPSIMVPLTNSRSSESGNVVNFSDMSKELSKSVKHNLYSTERLERLWNMKTKNNSMENSVIQSCADYEMFVACGDLGGALKHVASGNGAIPHSGHPTIPTIHYGQGVIRQPTKYNTPHPIHFKHPPKLLL